MTTELTPAPGGAGLTVATSTMPGPQEWAAVVGQATALAQSEIVPKAFRGQPHDIIAVSLIGREMGLSPMMSMQYINVIDGTPSVPPELMNARIRAAGHSITVVEWTNESCTLRGTRCDNGESMDATFTMDDARRANLVKDGSAWTKFPKAMLFARAMSMLGRAHFPDAILGARYVPEELGANVNEDGVVIEGDVVQRPMEALPAEQQAQVQQATAQPAQPLEAQAGAYSTAAPTDYVQPEPPPPPTPEELHAKEAKKLFPKGWPMGNCKGGDPTDPNAVDDGSLDYFIGKADVNHPQYGAKNAAQATWCRKELHRREQARVAAEPTGFEQPDADVSDIPFGSDGAPTADYDAGAYAAQRTDGTKARQEAEQAQTAFDNVTDVEVIEETAPADMPQPEWAAALPQFDGAFVDWNAPANSLDAAGMSADVQRLLAWTLAAAGRLDKATKQLVPVSREDAMTMVNNLNAQRIAAGDGPLTNRIAVTQIQTLAKRIGATTFP